MKEDTAFRPIPMEGATAFWASAFATKFRGTPHNPKCRSDMKEDTTFRPTPVEGATAFLGVCHRVFADPTGSARDDHPDCRPARSAPTPPHNGFWECGSARVKVVFSESASSQLAIPCRNVRIPKISTLTRYVPPPRRPTRFTASLRPLPAHLALSTPFATRHSLPKAIMCLRGRS